MQDSVYLESTEWKLAITLLNGKAYTPRRRWGAASCVVEDKLFISGGSCKKDFTFVYLKDAWLLRPGKNSEELVWEQIPDAPEEFEQRCQHSATLIGDNIWIIGGLRTDKIFDDVFTFNIKTRKWKQHSVRSRLALRRYGHAAVVSPKEPEKILLFGGCPPFVPDKSQYPEFAIFDTRTLTVVPVLTGGDKIVSRIGSIGIRAPDCKILFIGGWDAAESPMKGGACYDIEECTWRESYLQCKAVDGLIGGKAVTYNNRIYIYGGTQTGNPENCSADMVEITFGKTEKDTVINLIKSSNLFGRYHHVMFVVKDVLYTLQGREREEGSNSLVYYTDLKGLNQRLRQKEELLKCQQPSSSSTTAVPVRTVTVTNQRGPPISPVQQNKQALQKVEAVVWFDPEAKLARFSIEGELPKLIDVESNKNQQLQVEKMKTLLEEKTKNLEKSQENFISLQQELSIVRAKTIEQDMDLAKKQKEINALIQERENLKKEMHAVSALVLKWKNTSSSEDRPTCPDPKRQRT